MVSAAARCSAILVATGALALAAGCGDAPETRVFTQRAAPETALERYPSGSAERTLIELVRAAQSNDPTAVRQRVTAAWGATPDRIANAMPTISDLTLVFGTPRILSVRRGSRRTEIVMWWGRRRATLVFVAGAGGWRLARILEDGRPFSAGGLTSP